MSPAVGILLAIVIALESVSLVRIAWMLVDLRHEVGQLKRPVAAPEAP